jgi:pyrroline-5-carboxylate reductase
MKTGTKRTAILGSGNIGMSLAKGLVKADYCKPEDITLTRRSVQRLDDCRGAGLSGRLR